MKKLCLVLIMAALLPLSSVCVEAVGGIVHLEVGYDDPTNSQTNPNRTPILVPEVSIDEYTLTFDNACLGCELRLLNEDGELVYTTTITSTTLVLPAYLSGEYELQIIQGYYYFYGDIDL